MPITVAVTAQHIAQGVPGDCDRCAIALALRDAGMTDGWIDGDIIKGRMPGDAEARKWSAPDKVGEFVDRFDLGRPVKPFEFTLPDPDMASAGA